MRIKSTITEYNALDGEQHYCELEIWDTHSGTILYPTYAYRIKTQTQEKTGLVRRVHRHSTVLDIINRILHAAQRQQWTDVTIGVPTTTTQGA